MRADFFEFTPSHKIWLASNHLPAIAGTDHAIWRRILLVDAPLSPLRIGRQPAVEDRRPLDEI